MARVRLWDHVISRMISVRTAMIRMTMTLTGRETVAEHTALELDQAKITRTILKEKVGHLKHGNSS